MNLNSAFEKVMITTCSCNLIGYLKSAYNDK